MDRLLRATAQSVRRMFELDGLSCERIARQAGQPVEVVRKYLRLAYREPGDGLPWAEQRRSPNAESQAKSGPYKRRDTGQG